MKEIHSNGVSPRITELVERRKPGMTLEQPFYCDPEIFRTDIERIHKRLWLFAGHVSRIPNPCDYFLFNFHNESIIVVRGKDGEVHAFFNVCRHRGSRVCLELSGSAKQFICPYHHWTYDTNGSLLAARHMPKTFDCSASGLHGAHCRVMEGLIFICLAEEPPDFDIVFRDMLSHIEPYEIATAKICHSSSYDVRANWKLIVENFRECYHCGPAHPEYCRAVIGAASLDSAADRELSLKVRDEKQRRWKELGLETRDIPFNEHNWHHATRYPFRPGFESESLDGKPVGPMLGRLKNRDTGIFAIVIYPMFWYESSSDYAVTMSFIPVGPTLTRIEMNWLVHGDAVEGRDFDPERVTAFWRMTGEQDWKICEDNQAGVLSDRYQPGPYAPSESSVEVFIKWYLNQLKE